MSRLVALPLSKSLQMAYQSIRVRFFRSLVTTMSLVLAVAFLTFIQTGNDMASGLLHSGEPTMERNLSKAGYDINPETHVIESSAKQRWIVFLSLLTCVVGIINAQLMSVTERFREIGTLKCLGALDRFIVRIFVIEATLQGVTGGFAGALLGGGVGVLSTLIKFGLSSFAFIPWSTIGLTMFYAMCIGTVLSLVGVLYPAIVASRMQPVEAMRVEQ
ncbi:ABC transporter permease [Desulforhopalus sp. IMCC35007]|uniref:ABC transporter permease n=1 Tax=Desulforhopalus sp. IMCC35007 TaxID=2569543 RepID=UPI0010AE5EA1|nr:FtsX-like permease family protein [Desulforhopalus sp. IMCC35007]TKB06325.1 FtsX-like permease family protein [Desulforhopalus sp. IMCC35007]